MPVITSGGGGSLPSEWTVGSDGSLAITEGPSGPGTGIVSGIAADDENFLFDFTTATGSTEFHCDVNGRILVNDVNNNTVLETHEGAALAGSQIGFFGANPVARPAVSGSKSANAALTSLCVALANLGLITNNTT